MNLLVVNTDPFLTLNGYIRDGSGNRADVSQSPPVFSNSTAWEAAWSHFAIALPETVVGTGEYMATLPTGLPAGHYTVVALLQVGSIAAYTDIVQESFGIDVDSNGNLIYLESILVPSDPLKCRVTGYASAGPDGVKAGRVYTFTLYSPPQFDSNGVGIYSGTVTRYSDEDGRVIVDLEQGLIFQVNCPNQGIKNAQITIPSAPTALLSVLIG